MNGLEFLLNDKASELIDKYYVKDGRIEVSNASQYALFQEALEALNQATDISEKVSKTLESMSEKQVMRWLWDITNDEYVLGDYGYAGSFDEWIADIENMIASETDPKSAFSSTVEAFFA